MLARKLIRDKRGAELGVMVMVILAILSVMTTIIVLVQSDRRISSEMIYPGFIDSAVLKEKQTEENLFDAGRKALTKSYIELIEGKGYLDNTLAIKNNGDYEFQDLNPNLDYLFKEKIFNNFNKEIASYNFDGINLEFSNEILRITLPREFLSGYLVKDNKIQISDLSENAPNYLAKLRYTKVLLIKINLTQEGLEDFNVIYNTKEECKTKTNKQEIENCFNEKLKNFKATAEEKTLNDNSGKYWLVNLKGKRQFLIDDNLKQLEFAFVPV